LSLHLIGIFAGNIADSQSFAAILQLLLAFCTIGAIL